jgi:hypothetical protein
MKLNQFIIKASGLLAGIILLTSCGDRSPLLPNVTGRAGEVVLVMNAPLWESESGKVLGGILASEHPGLMQYEPMFDIVRIGHAAFSNIFKTHRNIVIVNVSGNYQDTRMSIRNDAWAKPQTILEINAKDTESLLSFVENQGDRILEELISAERKRILDYNSEMELTSIREHLSESFDISLTVPRGYNIIIDTTDFIWIRHDPRRITRDIIQGVFVYQYDYTDSETFTPEYLVSKRDEMLKKYVDGPSPGSWMATETTVFPEFTEFMENDRYFARLEGLWKVENDFMGGPFVSHTTLDEERNKVVTVEAFVYAPGDKKRNLLRQVEAILHTLEIEE